jgi:hypothetical protein
MLDERKNATGHESSGAHWSTAARDLGDLDDPAPDGDFHPATGFAGRDLVTPRRVPGINDDLDRVAFHIEYRGWCAASCPINTPDGTCLTLDTSLPLGHAGYAGYA